MLRYWLRIVNQDKHIEITKAITTQVSGSIRINELAGNFSFECKNLKDEDNNFINSIPEGSEITITNKELTEVILHSFVLDDGIEIVSSDRKNDSFYFAFSVKCLEKDFSVSAIDEIIFTDTNFSDIISELLNYSDDSLGGEDTPKIKLNFSDFLVNAFTTQKKGLQDTLTDLVEQFDLFWTFNYKISLDTANNIKVIRYIVISNKDGIAPDSNSFWVGGINTNTVKTGYLENTFTGSKLKLLPAETDIKIKRDNSVIINQLELTGKIFSLDNSESLTRLVFPAEPSKFTYDLGVFASDIKYISFNLRPSKDPVKLLENNTNTSIKIPSNFSLDIKTGDIAYFPNYSLTDFFPVLSVNKIDNIKTEVIFNTLPFLPAENDSFEIISNVEIFEEDNTTQSQINYASKGVVKQLQKNQNAKITFLDLSEPPPGVEISVFLYKLQDQNLKLKNSESIKERGLRYREIKLDDDLILNYQALNELGQKLLQDKPRYLINVSSLRYNLAPLGLSIPFNVNNLYQNNVILQENRFNFSHVDENKKPVFMQNIVFSNLVSDPNKYIMALKRQTANNRKIKKAERELRNENIFILENIIYSLEKSFVIIKEYFINSNTIIYHKMQNSLNNSINSNHNLILENEANFEEIGYILYDSYNLNLISLDSYAYIPSHSVLNCNEFTYRICFYVESLNSENVIISRFDTQGDVNAAQFYLAWNNTYGLWLGLYDVNYQNNSNSINSTYYHNSSVTLNDDTIYNLQFSYKESTRQLLIVLNETEIIMTRFLESSGNLNLSNITLKTNANPRLLIGAAFGNSGEVGKSNIKILRFAFDTIFRNLNQAIADKQALLG